MKPDRRYNRPRPQQVEEKKEPVEVKEKVDSGDLVEPVKDYEAVVDGVSMSLNIRMKPKVEPNNQVAILDKGVKLFVHEPDKTIKSGDGEEWYKVRLQDGTKGYAMKKYIRMI